MIPQPSYAQAGSVYYICLLRDDLLLHQGKRIKQPLKGQVSACPDQLAPSKSHLRPVLKALVGNT